MPKGRASKAKGSSAGEKAEQRAAQRAREESERRQAEESRSSEEGERREEEEEEGAEQVQQQQQQQHQEDLHEQGGHPPEDEELDARASCSFPASKEDALVAFFEANPCFYDKGDEKYSNSGYKQRLMQTLAQDLNTTTRQITGWWKNQRSALGRLYKGKSGQAAKRQTSRQRWLVSNLAFLKLHIVPRSYATETAQLQDPQPIPSGDEEEPPTPPHPPTEIPSSDEDPEPLTSTSRSTVRPSSQTSMKSWHSSSGSRSGRTMKRKVDDALLDYISRPRAADILLKQLDTIAVQNDERAAFSHFLAVRMAKIKDCYWEEFQQEAFALVSRYINRKSPSSSPSPAPTSRDSSSEGHEREVAKYPGQVCEVCKPRQRW